MAYTQNGISFGAGTGSSPLNKNGDPKKKQKSTREEVIARSEKRSDKVDKTDLPGGYERGDRGRKARDEDWSRRKEYLKKE